MAWIETTNHIQLYDIEPYVTQAITVLGHAGPIGPAPPRPGGPPLLIGGNVAATFRRMVEFGAGWFFGGGGPEAFAAGADRARRAWGEAHRGGRPRLVANAYASLGDNAEAHARRYLGDYYAFVSDFVAQITAGALTSAPAVADAIVGFEEAGCDELILFPCNPDVTQISLIAEAAGL
jgi:alkanesulfonate monooxygenase SsuD/methylene tetrahydromethanopterin reductase-like flavin-dependent oxidoreductase (luciferase family)